MISQRGKNSSRHQRLLALQVYPARRGRLNGSAHPRSNRMARVTWLHVTVRARAISGQLGEADAPTSASFPQLLRCTRAASRLSVTRQSVHLSALDTRQTK